MNVLSVVETIISMLGMFFSKNPTVVEVEVILPQVVMAIASAKAGQAFSVSFPEAIDGVNGTSTFGWVPLV